MIDGDYLLFLGREESKVAAKTALGLRAWRPDRCVAQWRLDERVVDVGLPDMTPAQATLAGARTMVLGIAPTGGQLDPEWIAAMVVALDAGMDVASGMHRRLNDIPELQAAARRNGRWLHDVRHPDRTYGVASGTKRSGLRLLTVGTDCAVGKKYAALAIHAELRRRGLPATFRATGQTGILIAGDGVPIDAVISDFVAGAAEMLSPVNDPDHWDVIEGQGSLFHPAYAGVSLGLLHGSQPDAIVVCHDPNRSRIDGYDAFPAPSLESCIARNIEAGRLTNPAIRCAGVAVNCSGMDAATRDAVVRDIENSLGVPCFDPIATGAGVLVDAVVPART